MTSNRHTFPDKLMPGTIMQREETGYSEPVDCCRECIYFVRRTIDYGERCEFGRLLRPVSQFGKCNEFYK